MWGLGVQGRLGIPPRPTPSGFVLFGSQAHKVLLQRGGICPTSPKYPSHSCFICPWSLHECTTTITSDQVKRVIIAPWPGSFSRAWLQLLIAPLRFVHIDGPNAPVLVEDARHAWIFPAIFWSPQLGSPFR